MCQTADTNSAQMGQSLYNFRLYNPFFTSTVPDKQDMVNKNSDWSPSDKEALGSTPC